MYDLLAWGAIEGFGKERVRRTEVQSWELGVVEPVGNESVMDLLCIHLNQNDHHYPEKRP